MNGTQSFFGFIGRIGIALFFLVMGALNIMNIDQSTGLISEGLDIIGVGLDENLTLWLAYGLAYLKILAALFILFGYWARLGALGLAAGCVISILLLNVPGLTSFDFTSSVFQENLTATLKNAAILGGLLYVVATGTGGFSLGRRRRVE